MLIKRNRIGRRWLGQPISTPRALFNNAENGVFWDFSDPRSLYTDASGTIALTAPDTPIRLAADKSRTRSPITAYAAIQANTGLAPRYGRAPKSRRNTCTETEFRNGVTDAPVRGGAVTAAVIAGYAGALQLDRDVADTYAYKAIPYTGAVRTISCVVEMPDGLGPPVISGTSALSDMRLIGEGATIPVANHIITPLGGNLYRVSAWLNPTGAGTSWGCVKYPVFTARPVRFTAMQIEGGNVATAIQSVKTAYEMTEAGVPSFGYARPDLIDDVLNAVMTLAQTGDVLLFGRNGSWIEAGRVFAAGSSFQVGVTGTAITPGILAALGDLVGIVAVGRTLTTDERARALRYFKAAGAAGWLTPGAEMLAIGDFASGTGWNNASTGTGTMAISGGQLSLTGVDGSNRGWASLAAALSGAVIGQPYQLQYDVVSGTANQQVVVTSGGTVLNVQGAASPGRKTAVFVAGSTGIGFSTNVYSAGTVVIDNISIKPLTAGA